MQRWFRLEGKKQNTLFWVRWPRYPGQVTCLSSDVMMMSFRNPRCCRFVVMSPQTGAHMSCYFYVKPGTRVHTASGLKGPIKILWFPWQQHEVGAGSSSPPWCPSFTPTEVQFTVQKIRQAAARTSSAAEGKLRSQAAEDAPRPQIELVWPLFSLEMLKWQSSRQFSWTDLREPFLLMLARHSVHG